MKLGWPQWIFLGVCGLHLFAALVQNGEWKEPERFDFYKEAVFVAVTIAFLWWGGFF